MDALTPLQYMKRRRDELAKHLVVWKSGRLRSGSNDGSGWVDTTVEVIARDEAALAELSRIISSAEADEARNA